MSNRYTHQEKKRLAEKIGKIKKKEYLIKILKIIKKEKQGITSNDNGLLMYFHDLNDDTYDLISEVVEEYEVEHTEDNVDKIFIEKASYQPYATDEFPSQSKISPKLKYSNKEKNILKRRRYDNIHSSDNSDVYYKDFDINSTKSPSSNDS